MLCNGVGSATVQSLKYLTIGVRIDGMCLGVPQIEFVNVGRMSDECMNSDSDSDFDSYWNYTIATVVLIVIETIIMEPYIEIIY